MKKLMLALLLGVMSVSVNANEIMGGILERRSTGGHLAMSCASLNNENKCEEVDVLYRYAEEKEFEVIANLKALDLDKISKRTLKEANRQRRRRYAAHATAGTIATTFTCGMTGAGCVFIPVGMTIDVVKAPFLFTSYVGHEIINLFNSGRFKRHIKYMMNSKKKGKTRKIGKNSFGLLSENLRYN